METATAETQAPPMQRQEDNQTDKWADYAESTADNFAVRWGFNPATPRVRVNRTTNLPFNEVPFCQPFLITPFETSQENVTLDLDAPREQLVTVTAVEHQQRIAGTLKKQGFTTFWKGEADKRKVDVYFELLLPRLTEIEWECEGRDDNDLRPRDRCPSCYLQYLQSTAFSGRLGAAVKAGAVKKEEANALKHQLIDSFVSAITYLQDEWGATLDEYNRGNAQITFQADEMRKNIHAPRPEDREVNIAKAQADVQSKATADLVKGVVGEMQSQNVATTATVVAEALKQAGIVSPQEKQDGKAKD